MKVLKSLIDETAILSGICSTDPQRDRYVFFSVKYLLVLLLNVTTLLITRHYFPRTLH